MAEEFGIDVNTFCQWVRRMVMYGELKKDIGWILRKLCDEKG